MEPFKSTDEVERTKRELDLRIEAFLLNSGWERCRWYIGIGKLYERKIAGRSVTADAKLAVSFQSRIEHLQKHGKKLSEFFQEPSFDEVASAYDDT